MKSVESINEELSRLASLDTWGTKKEINSLPEVLYEDEEIKYLTSGLMNNSTWLAVCTSNRVLFLDKGLLFGLKQVEIPLNRVNSISFKTGAFFGEIHIWDGASQMKIEQCDKRTVKPFVDAVNLAISDLTSLNVKEKVESISISEQLEKLAGLFEKGLLTKEEFTIQKEKLLKM